MVGDIDEKRQGICLAAGCSVADAPREGRRARRLTPVVVT
jgi:hypothetical protein